MTRLLSLCGKPGFDDPYVFLVLFYENEVSLELLAGQADRAGSCKVIEHSVARIRDSLQQPLDDVLR